MARVILFGGGLQMISVARSLKTTGHYVFAITKYDKVAKKSNFIDRYEDIESDRDLHVVTSKLIEFIHQDRIDVVIPMEDAQATSLSQCKKNIEIKTQARCAVMDWDVFRMVSDKTKLLEFCKINDIPHPRTALITDDIDVVAEEVGFPSLIKPSHSEGAKGIVLVNNLEELKEKAPLIISEYGECGLQEYITSKPYYYNLMLYRSQSGEFGNSVIIKILRFYPIKGGSSCLAVTVKNEVMTEICKKLLNKLNWVGFADFDILEKEDGDFRIIEINPRVPASVRGAAISGVNFPEMIVEDLMNGYIKKYTFREGEYLRYLGLDIAWFLASPSRFSCSPSWFKFFGKHLHYQEGGMKDLPAMATSIIEGIKKQLNPEFRKKKSGMN